MNEKNLSEFFLSIQNHEWITPAHISVYTSIFELWNQNRFENPINISRSKIMMMAKISGKATYHKCIKGLVKGKYIIYLPSYNPFLGSLVYLITKDF